MENKKYIICTSNNVDFHPEYREQITIKDNKLGTIQQKKIKKYRASFDNVWLLGMNSVRYDIGDDGNLVEQPKKTIKL